MNNCSLKVRGFGLVEIIIASAVLTMVMLDIFAFFQSTLKVSRSTETENQASYLLEEGMEVLKTFRDTSYDGYFAKMSTTTSYYLAWDQTNSKWATTTVNTLIDGKYTRKFSILDVKRNSSSFDVSTTTSGTFDPNIKLATVSISWPKGTAQGVLTPLTPPKMAVGVRPEGIFMSHDGLSVYVVTYGEDRVYQYSRDLTTGLLTPLSPAYTAGGYPIGNCMQNGAVSPDDRHVYVTASCPGSISEFNRNTTPGPDFGKLTYIDVSQGFEIGTSGSLKISADGGSVYVPSLGTIISPNPRGVIQMLTRDSVTGHLTPMATSPFINSDSFELGISPDSLSVYVANYQQNNVSQLNRDSGTGELTAMDPQYVTAGGIPYAVVVSPDGTNVYVANGYGTSVAQYTRNTTPGPDFGKLTFLGNVASGGSPFDIAISSDGIYVYVLNWGDEKIRTYVRDVSTGLLSLRGSVSTGLDPRHMAVSPDGVFVYVTNFNDGTISMYRRDLDVSTRTIQAYITNIFDN